MLFTYIRSNKKTIPKFVSGFTLIELLVVIAIIGILSSVVLASLNTARMKARDAKRIQDLKQIKIALELFYDTNGYYPEEASAGWETTYNNVDNFIDVLRTSGLMSKVPVDPINNTNYHYSYYNYPSGSSGCNFSYAVITIRKFETANSNIGVSAVCPSRNWYPEFNYSILLPQ